MDTYFTFPDAALSYDCGACRQRCCRGKGIALSERELTQLLPRAPALAPLLRLRAGGALAAQNVADGCWFLGGDGMCRIEAEHGRGAKPGTCRLFPFNRVYRVGEVRVVDVNSVLCPVEAAAGDGVRHGDLLAEIDELAAGGSPLLDVPAAAPEDLPPGWLERERELAAAAAADPAPAALCRAAGVDAEGDAAAWARLYGLSAVEGAAAAAAAAGPVALLSSSLRWNRLFRKGAPRYAEAAPRLPRRLRALTLLGGLAARLGGRPPSLRTLSELWEGQGPVLDVLERWGEPARLVAPRFDADVPALLQPALGAFLGAAFRGGRTLGELVEAAAQPLPAEARPLALSLAAGQLPSLQLEPR